MSDKEIETLSALMDGEVDEVSLHRVLNQVDNQAQMKSKWRRYHLAQDIMKGQTSAFSEIDLSVAVSEALKDEASPKSNRTWLKAMGGMSVAASVAIAVVLGARFNTLDQADYNVADAQPQAQQNVVAPANDSMLVNHIDASEAQELQQAQQRLNEYLKQHAQDSGYGQGQTAMPFARVVNFKTDKGSE